MKNKLVLSIFVSAALLLLSNNKITAQNIAINGTGTAAVASAMLDITSTTSGLLIPRMTAAQRAAIGTPAASLLVYQTDAGTMGIGYYFYNGTTWVPFGTNNGGWGLAGNAGTAIATNFIGTTDAIAFAIRTNNTEKARFTTTGEFVVGSATPFAGDIISGYGTYGVNGYSTAAGGIGVYGENGLAGGGSGVVGLTSGATGFGAYGINANANGTGVFGVGNNLGGNYLTVGSGGALTGRLYGLYAASTQTGATQAAAVYGYNTAINIVTWLSLYNGTYYKTVASGAALNSCSVPDVDGNMVCMHAPETPEAYFQDYGEGKLVNGKVHINLDPTLAINVRINEKHPLRVFVQIEGDCNGVYITNKTETGFDVIELANGTSNTSFQWTVICNMRDAIGPNGLVSKFEDLRFEPSPFMEEIKTAEKQKNVRK